MMLKIKWIFIITSLIGLILIVGGVVSGMFLQTTVMQVDSTGESSTSTLYAGRTYRLAGIPYDYACKGTICLFTDSVEVLRRTIDSEAFPDESVNLIIIGSFQVEQTGTYTLTSVEPQVGAIIVQETPIQSILGIDDLILPFVGFALLFISVISARLIGIKL